LDEKKPNFFSKNLRAYLFAYRLEREQIAKLLKVTTQTVSRWILDNRAPSGLQVDGAAANMGVSAEALMNKDLTLHFLQQSGYIKIADADNLVAEPNGSYDKYSSKIIAHLERQQVNLESMMESNQELLILLK